MESYATLIGVLLVFDARATALPAAVALVALIAPFHGAAHAAEMPDAASTGLYAAGLLCATALLQGAGFGVGIALRSRPLLLRALAAPLAVAAGGHL